MNETPECANETIEKTFVENTLKWKKFNDRFDMIVDNEFYQETTSNDQSQQKAQIKKYAETSGAVYEEVNKKKEISKDLSMDPGNSSNVDINGDTYALVDNEEAKYEIRIFEINWIK